LHDERVEIFGGASSMQTVSAGSHGWLRRLCGSGARIRLFARLPLTPYEWALAPLVVPEVEVIGDPQCVEPGGFGTFGPIEI
jgi:hypothetical protein